MTEFEKKMLLNKEEYNYLMEHLGHDGPLFPKPIVKQINYYYDTDDYSMNRQNITCRIRLKDGKYKATMKKHSGKADQSSETEMEVRDGIRDNAFIDMGLKLQGELTTHRCIILKYEHCEVVLDKNEYLGTFDYELEIEYLPEYEKDAQSIYRVILDMLTCRKCFLAYKESLKETPDVPSKSSRFFEKISVSKNVPQAPAFKSSRNYNTKFDYSDPDDYMHDYFDAVMPSESVCLSCEHFDGSSAIHHPPLEIMSTINQNQTILSLPSNCEGSQH